MAGRWLEVDIVDRPLQFLSPSLGLGRIALAKQNDEFVASQSGAGS